MSKKPHAAFYAISKELPAYAERLMAIPDCPMWVHESVVSSLIGLPKSKEHGPSEALTSLLQCIKDSYGGNKRKGTRAKHAPTLSTT